MQQLPVMAWDELDRSEHCLQPQRWSLHAYCFAKASQRNVHAALQDMQGTADTLVLQLSF